MSIEFQKDAKNDYIILQDYGMVGRVEQYYDNGKYYIKSRFFKTADLVLLKKVHSFIKKRNCLCPFLDNVKLDFPRVNCNRYFVYKGDSYLGYINPEGYNNYHFIDLNEIGQIINFMHEIYDLCDHWKRVGF